MLSNVLDICGASIVYTVLIDVFTYNHATRYVYCDTLKLGYNILQCVSCCNTEDFCKKGVQTSHYPMYRPPTFDYLIVTSQSINCGR